MHMIGQGASHVRYLRTLLALIAVPWLLAVATNVAIDPHGLSGRTSFLGLQTVPVDYPDPRFSKVFTVERIRPETIALGTSRTDHAIDVLYPDFVVDEQSTYNLGIDAAEMSEILAYLKHASTVAPIHRVVLGLDFFSFSDFGRPAVTESDILATPDDPRWVARSDAKNMRA